MRGEDIRCSPCTRIIHPPTKVPAACFCLGTVNGFWEDSSCSNTTITGNDFADTTFTTTIFDEPIPECLRAGLPTESAE